jgi:tripartite-type tricarboxylate transporter receptor subunit TctC
MIKGDSIPPTHCQRSVLPRGTPKDRVEILQDAMRKVFKDPEFRAEFQKLVSDDVSPLMPEELAKVIRECPAIPRSLKC